MSPTLASLHRLRGQPFAAKVYERLLPSHPAIRAKFARTDFDRQNELLEHGVFMLLEYASGSALGKMAIDRLAAMHGPGKLDVSPNLYPYWIDAVVATVRELDPEWDDAVERAWRRDLAKGIDVMTSAHARG